MKRNVLVTGAAGFIGAAIIKKLILNGDTVIGIDNLSAYYDISLKKNRLRQLENFSSDTFHTKPNEFNRRL